MRGFNERDATRERSHCYVFRGDVLCCSLTNLGLMGEVVDLNSSVSIEESFWDEL
jgi:hypothetical protein